MPYKQRKYRFPNAIEIEEYHTARYGAPGEPREKKEKATPEQMARRNHYNKVRSCRHKLRANFKKQDHFLTLNYKPDKRPADMEEAKEDFRKLVRILKREAAKVGADLKWIRNIEVGTRGAWHIHVVMNAFKGSEELIRDLWTKGGVYFEALHQRGEYQKLAEYITKTPREDSRLRESNYSASRNLPVPAPEEKIFYSWATFRKITPRPGWYLDKESLYEGVNEITGQPYRRYTLLRIEPEQIPKRRKRE